MKINEINSWDDWCKSFQSIETFDELIVEIFERHQLKMGEIAHTYPGTNAVFKVGEYIIKIFVPDGVKPWDADDYKVEYEHAVSMKHLCNDTPFLYAAGEIQKEKVWKYLVFEYVEGKHVYQVLGELTFDEKVVLVNELKQFLKEFHQTKDDVDNAIIVNRVVQGDRWDFLNDQVKQELHTYLMNLDISNSVVVHGDITGDNVLLTDKGIMIIDFGDSCIAPIYYEYAPIVLDLFQSDPECMKLFFDEVEEGIEDTIKSILLHDFGGDMASKIVGDEDIQSLEDLIGMIRVYLKRIVTKK